MIVYGSSISPYVRKVLVLCAEKGIAVDNQVFGPGVAPTADFVAASPFKKIPALKDGDFTLADSTAIAHYIDAKHPEPRLIPQEPELLGKVVWFDEFSDTIGFAAGGKIFWNRVVGPLVKAPHDPAIADKAQAEEMPPCLAYLESVVTDGWLVGGRFTLADIAVGSFLVNYDFSGGDIGEGNYPRLSAYLKRVHGPPLVQDPHRQGSRLPHQGRRPQVRRLTSRPCWRTSPPAGRARATSRTRLARSPGSPPQTRLLICGQAPGRRVHESGRPFTDASGDRLRVWMGVNAETFYGDKRIGVASQAFCYPGTNPKGGDYPPPKRCAELWRRPLLDGLRGVEFTLLVGGHAQAWALGDQIKPSMTQTVAAWREYLPAFLPMPHPSWRNTGWLKREPWFEREVVPYLRERVAAILSS